MEIGGGLETAQRSEIEAYHGDLKRIMEFDDLEVDLGCNGGNGEMAEALLSRTHLELKLQAT